MKKFFGLLAAFFAFFIKNPLCADKTQKDQPQKNSGGQKEKKIKEEIKILSKKELSQKLKELKEKPLPQDLSQGAMCYKVAGPPDRIEYVCPICGSKTIYKASPEYYLAKDMNYIRGLMKPLMNFGITLDERALCKKCASEITEKTLCIEIPYQDEKNKPFRRCAIDQNDLKLMGEFLAGKDRHETGNGFEEPLAKFISDLESLFGVKANQ